MEEAIRVFEKANPTAIPERGSLRIQFDYMRAYLDFYIGLEENYSVAREISAKYENYPVLHWKLLFLEIK